MKIKTANFNNYTNFVYTKIEQINTSKFYLFLLLFIILSRILVIFLTPQAYDFADPVIYRMTGQLAAEGINPYNFHENFVAREDIASSWIHKYNSFMNNGIADFNYYVSSNLPASTILYVFMYNFSNNDPFVWRSFLIFGDILTLFGFIFLSLQLSVCLKSTEIKLGSLFLFGLYPSLILNGTAIPEDKQFQTALLFLGLAAILMNNKFEKLTGLYVGFILGLGVLFKFFSAFLLPVYLLDFFKRGWDFRIISASTGIFLLLISLYIYGIDFIETMSSRSVRSSMNDAQHASIWTLFQSKYDFDLLYVKSIVCSTIIIYIIISIFNKKIDILNSTAAILVVFSVIWLIDGSMNRANISMIFAAGVFLLTNPQQGIILIFLNVIVHSFIIILMILNGWNLGFYEAISSLFFLISYFSLLFLIKNVFKNDKIDHLFPILQK